MNREEFLKTYEQQRYLGDGLYAHFDGYYIILSAERENGCHWVGLEPGVFEALLNYRSEVYAAAVNIKDE